MISWREKWIDSLPRKCGGQDIFSWPWPTLPCCAHSLRQVGRPLTQKTMNPLAKVLALTRFLALGQRVNATMNRALSSIHRIHSTMKRNARFCITGTGTFLFELIKYYAILQGDCYNNRFLWLQMTCMYCGFFGFLIEMSSKHSKGKYSPTNRSRILSGFFEDYYP